MLEIKPPVTEKKNDFDELSSRLDMIEGRIFELEDVTIEALRTERQRERLGKKKEKNIQRLWDNYRRMSICEMGIHEGEKRREPKRYLK